MKKNIFISAGESSGDLHASNLVKKLKEIDKDFIFTGLGCEKMQNQGVRLIKKMDELAIVGVWEIISKLPLIMKLFGEVKKEIKRQKIDLAILVDYPGFNLKLASIFKKNNIPCIYYITPQFWAWGEWRVKKFKKIVDKAIVIFDFEKTFFQTRGVKAEFVGHPLLDEATSIDNQKNIKNHFGLMENDFVIGIAPGSREQEILKILPVMAKALKIIKSKKPDVKFLMSKTRDINMDIYKKIVQDIDIQITEANIYDMLSATDFVLCSSGTVTLQIALSEKPMLITYITSFLTTFLAEIVLKIPFIGLVNIIAGKEIVPEALTCNANPKYLADKTLEIINSDEKMQKMKEDLRAVKNRLGNPGAAKRAAETVYTFLKQQQ